MEAKMIYIMRRYEDRSQTLDGVMNIEPTKKGLKQNARVQFLLGEDFDKISMRITQAGPIINFLISNFLTSELVLGARADEVDNHEAYEAFDYRYYGDEYGEYGGFADTLRGLDEIDSHILIVENGNNIFGFLQTIGEGDELIKKYKELNYGSIFAVSYSGLWKDFCRIAPENKSWPLKIEWACDPNFSNQRDYGNNVAAALRETVSVPPGGAALAKPGPGES